MTSHTQTSEHRFRATLSRWKWRHIALLSSVVPKGDCLSVVPAVRVFNMEHLNLLKIIVH